MKSFIQILIGLLAATLLAACGGGGGGGSNEGGSFTPSELRVTIDPVSSTATPSSVISITVRVNNNNGVPVADGTSVTLSSTPSDLALVSSFNAPPNLGPSTTTTTRGGVAQFRLHTRATGTVTLRATATAQSGGSSTATLNVNIVAGPGNDQRLTFQTQSTSIPVNPGVPFFIGSPFVSVSTITFRRLDGTLIQMPDGVVVAIQPGSTGFCAFSTLDDGTTPDVNESTIPLGSGPVDVNAGVALIYVWSFGIPGTCNIVISGQDPDTGETVSITQTFTIVGATNTNPTAVFIDATTDPLYVQGSGGTTAIPVSATVLDGNNRPIANPAVGVNNVRVEIVSGPGGGERLTGVNAAGQTVSGTSISLRTTNGVVGFSLISGNRTGPVVIRVTADRTDNNVDNGIQDPVIATRTVIISDGRLFDLDIANRNAVVVDSISGPPDQPNPVYTITITVIATDRDGNPVIPGTQIDFGLIDTPLAGSDFAIMGNDGNPQEGATFFNAPTGNFSLAGPGDTLVVFGEEIPGQRDMEAARFITQITSINSLLVARPFNRNDTTGVIVDGGPIFPYVIGRAANGNITASAVTDENGVASATLRYSQSAVGNPVIVWAQGSGIAANGTPNLVADVERLTFAGAGPATLTAQPSQVEANSTRTIRLCLRDANMRGIPNAVVGFTATTPAGGIITVDGRTPPGTAATPTGPDGCTNVVLQSQNLTNQGGVVTFTAGGASTTVTINPVGTNISLSASPSSFFVPRNFIVATTLTLTGVGGQPIAGASINVACQTTGGSLEASGGVTDANGQFISFISGNGFVTDPDGPGAPPNMPPENETGQCIYRVTGNPTVSAGVIIQGNGMCNNISPPGSCG